VFVDVLDGEGVGLSVEVFVGGVDGELTGVVVSIRAGVFTESVTSVRTGVLLSVVAIVILLRVRVGVDNCWTDSVELTVVFKVGIGTANKPYRIAIPSPATPRYPAAKTKMVPSTSARHP
jgi:hypothetical protein